MSSGNSFHPLTLYPLNLKFRVPLSNVEYLFIIFRPPFLPLLPICIALLHCNTYTHACTFTFMLHAGASNRQLCVGGHHVLDCIVQFFLRPFFDDSHCLSGCLPRSNIQLYKTILFGNYYFKYSVRYQNYEGARVKKYTKTVEMHFKTVSDTKPDVPYIS